MDVAFFFLRMRMSFWSRWLCSLPQSKSFFQRFHKWDWCRFSFFAPLIMVKIFRFVSITLRNSPIDGYLTQPKNDQPWKIFDQQVSSQSPADILGLCTWQKVNSHPLHPTWLPLGNGAMGMLGGNWKHILRMLWQVLRYVCKNEGSSKIPPL